MKEKNEKPSDIKNFGNIEAINFIKDALRKRFK